MPRARPEYGRRLPEMPDPRIAALAAPWLQPLLYKESARDPLTYAAVGSVMLLVAAAASTIPALRASRVDPCGALRSD